MGQDLIETIEDGVATLRLNRPEAANALSMEIFDGLLEALPRLGRDPAVGVIVLTGTGRQFCAGGDVKGMKGSELTYEQRVDQLQRKQKAVLALHDSPKVTIASINGAAAGAGLSLALACDLRIAARAAKFVTSFVKIGFAGDFGGTYFLSRLVGPARAKEMYLLSEAIDAEAAMRLGMLSKLVEDAELASATASLASSIAAGPRLAYRYIKRNFDIAATGSLSEVLESEASNQMRLALTEDHAEATNAFREKRKPVFKGC